MRVQTYASCKICGSPHNTPCPGWRLNAEQEAIYNAEQENRSRLKMTAELLFPGQPDLVNELRRIQAKWLKEVRA